MAKYNTQARVN